MKNIFKIIIGLTLSLAFLASVFCHCMAKTAWGTLFSSKSVCHACHQKSTDGKAQDCCLSKASPAETPKHFVWNQKDSPIVQVGTVSDKLFVPSHLALNSTYAQGPPRIMSPVPLFILQRSIRI